MDSCKNKLPKRGLNKRIIRLSFPEKKPQKKGQDMHLDLF